MATAAGAADDNDLIFAADDKFADVIRCLEARGWRRHPHASFPGARLKWLNYRRIAWTASSAQRQTLNHLQHARDADAALLAEWALYTRALAELKHFASHGGAGGRKSEEAVDAACALAETAIAAGAAFFSRTTADAAEDVVIDVDAPEWQPLRCCSRDDSAEHLAAAVGAPRGDRASRVERALQELEAVDPQFDAVSGCERRSVWICKPAHLSQGRGIRLLTSLDATFKLRGDEGGDGAWVVQKYMEQPLLSLQGGRKFDIRQWVLITSLAPLRVFWHAQCYLRFCSQPFSLASARLGDQFVHLSNFSIQKDAGRAHEDAGATGGEGELMWSSERQEHGRDVWSESIVPQMQRATRAAILSTAPKLKAVGNGFEWLGLDFLLDASYRPWLLEVNVSPDVSHSTSVTAQLVPRATEDLLELILGDAVRPENGWIPLAC